jgi:threonine dehydrogenase-like Zn-dependent dehydrogenase
VIRAWCPSESGWPLAASELPAPVVADDGILVAVEASVVGSPERYPRAGIAPGGAAVGRVLEAGANALELRGQRVVIGPDMACGECDVCRRAAVAACPHRAVLGRTVHGTLASAVVARARWACVLEGGLHGVHIQGPAAALIGREAAWAYTMFVRAGVGPGDIAVIAGHDVVARFLVEIAIAKGARPLVLVTQDRPAWSAWIQARGGQAVSVEPGRAPEALNGVLAGALAAIRTAAGHGGERPWCIFATDAEPGPRNLALAAMTPGSRVVFLARSALGMDAAGPAMDVDSVVDADGTLLGVAGAHPDLLPEVAALAVRGDIDLAGASQLLAPEALAWSLDRLPLAADLPRALLVAPGA